MDPVKRALHNDLEKSRRVETSMLFMNLSMQVSFLDDNRKIPSKLSILRGAKRECDLMMLDERRLLSEKHVMQQKQRMLRERLFELRREHYHRRYGKQKQTSSHLSHNQQHQQQQYIVRCVCVCVVHLGYVIRVLLLYYEYYDNSPETSECPCLLFRFFYLLFSDFFETRSTFFSFQIVESSKHISTTAFSLAPMALLCVVIDILSTRILLHDASPPHTFFNAQYKID
ncbi:hypothetical protein AGLY_013336 [Aphis glycines]|uniref:BHLH domain-containing protein n=1 Tax=Aphis glycines TaxID=307491 RepID=A0A6G0T606_APHGL|nr:hypothetical protein AGLY_013336 [Aphis glycines]